MATLFETRRDSSCHDEKQLQSTSGDSRAVERVRAPERVAKETALVRERERGDLPVGGAA
jgi:hypothetical protein